MLVYEKWREHMREVVMPQEKKVRAMLKDKSNRVMPLDILDVKELREQLDILWTAMNENVRLSSEAYKNEINELASHK